MEDANISCAAYLRLLYAMRYSTAKPIDFISGEDDECRARTQYSSWIIDPQPSAGRQFPVGVSASVRRVVSSPGRCPGTLSRGAPFAALHGVTAGLDGADPSRIFSADRRAGAAWTGRDSQRRLLRADLAVDS